MKLCPLFSSSSGNATYLTDGRTHLLVDAGASCRAIRTALRELGADLCDLRAILVTHEHTDHIRGLPQITKLVRPAVYASPATAAAVRACLGAAAPHAAPLTRPLQIGTLTVTRFATPHDSVDCAGYRIEDESGCAAAVATDLGHVPEDVLDMLSTARLVMLESNHDREMLLNGPYPYPLKRRVASPRGHLSNEQCAAAVELLARRGVRRFVLAHLSTENNLPELAEVETRSRLAEAGFRPDEDVFVHIAPKCFDGRVIEF